LLFKAGKNRDGWFTNDDLAKQLQDTVLQLAEDLHPNCELCFAFDNSQAHHKAPDDGLDASKLPLKCGGKNVPTMRDGYFTVNEQRVIQRMSHENGIPKGLRQILMERGKWRNNMLRMCRFCKDKIPHIERTHPDHGLDATHELTTQTCCAWYTLSQEPDFKAQRELLREIVEDRGHIIIYYPKYHCELNFIEKIWGYVKAKTRVICDYSAQGLLVAVPQVLEDVPLSFVRRVYRKCLRFADGYRRGLEGPLLEYASRKFSSHRRIPEFVMAELGADFERWNKQLQKKRKRERL
jgi:hypothetical protein